jgi:hypothetical protein
MELRPAKKILFLVLAACIAFSVIFAESLTAAGHDHDCAGEGCPVCLCIEAANNLLKVLKLALLFAILTAFFASRAEAPPKQPGFTSYLFSPVALKVRFNS